MKIGSELFNENFFPNSTLNMLSVCFTVFYVILDVEILFNIHTHRHTHIHVQFFPFHLFVFIVDLGLFSLCIPRGVFLHTFHFLMFSFSRVDIFASYTMLFIHNFHHKYVCCTSMQAKKRKNIRRLMICYYGLFLGAFFGMCSTKRFFGVVLFSNKTDLKIRHG